MQSYARIVDGVVFEIWTATKDVPTPDKAFGTEFAASFVACSGNVQPGWTYADGKFAAPVAAVPPQDTASLIAYASDARWRKEVGGIEVNGVPVATDDRSKVMIIGARMAAQADPDWTTIWHGADGNAYPLDAAAMVALSDAVQAHVNATFSTFAAVKGEIEAGTVTAIAEIDALFQPAP